MTPEAQTILLLEPQTPKSLKP